MSVRRTVAGGLSAALVATGLLTASMPSAHAAVDPDDTTFTAVAADLIGAGSDTSQHAVFLLANAWNDQSPAPAFRVASFAATGGGTVTLPSGAEITRPNGSTKGLDLLHGATNNPEIDYARSSSTLSAAEATDGLKALPFAVDELAMAVSNETPSNAPASLTPTQIVGIYKGEITNWSQIDPSRSGVIEPKLPQSGSGTRKFFEAQLTAMNNNVAVNTTNIPTVQEHDDTAIKNNPNAVVPFSKGRAALLGTTLRIESGWQAQRALYNVVRGTDLNNADIQAVFGPTGFVCSDAARPLIEQAGFGQLDSEADGGECGVQTTTATTNFQVNRGEEQAVATATNLVAESPAAGQVKLTATVTPQTGTDKPAGTVTFLEGEAEVGTATVVDGVATTTLTGVASGPHFYIAAFQPGAGFTSSQSGPVEVSVKAASTVSVSISPSSTTKYGFSRTVKATVTSGGAAATGTVSIKVGTAAPVSRTLTNGVASLVVPSTKGAGKYAVTVTYSGNETSGSASRTSTLTIAKATPVVSETFPASTVVGRGGRGVVKVAISGSTVKPTGVVRIYQGSRLLKSATLSSGQATLALPRLSKGRKTLTIKYAGSANVVAVNKAFVMTQR